jgi:2'-5' RNA ligase
MRAAARSAARLSRGCVRLAVPRPLSMTDDPGGPSARAFGVAEPPGLPRQQQAQGPPSARRGRGNAGAGPRPRAPSPDHFIALRVPPDAVRPAFESLHAALAEEYSDMLVEAAAAHVTLGVVRLAPPPPLPPPADGGGGGDGGGGDDAPAGPPPSRRPPLPPDPDRLASAVDALEEAAAALRSIGGPLRLVVGAGGVGQFGRGRVLWVGVGDDDDDEDGGGGRDPPATLAEAEAAVRAALSARNLAAGRGGGFTPHVTVAKGRAWWGGGRRPRTIPPAAYSAAAAAVESVAFEVDSLQLCQMGGRAAGQYYRVVASARFC